MSESVMFDTLAYTNKLATKRDLKELENNLRRDLNELEIRLKHDLTLRLGVMLAACMTIIATIVKIIG